MGVFTHWPNRITAIRFVGSLVLFALFAVLEDVERADIGAHRGLVLTSFVLFVVVAGTDFLDGYLARRDNVVTAFGRIADPFTDKVLIVGALVFLTCMPWSRDWLPTWMVVLVLAREFLVTGLRGYVESQGGEFPADRFGKIKMIVQCATVGVLLLIWSVAWPQAVFDFWSLLAHVLVWSTVLTTVGSGITYVQRTMRILTALEQR